MWRDEYDAHKGDKDWWHKHDWMEFAIEKDLWEKADECLRQFNTTAEDAAILLVKRSVEHADELIAQKQNGVSTDEILRVFCDTVIAEIIANSASTESESENAVNAAPTDEVPH